jgi:hypothetical protein
MAAITRSRAYWFLALALAVFITLGFARTYYLRPLFELPPLDLIQHLHAIVFTAWVVLFVLQARLISKQNYRAHMRVGIAGVFLAALVVIVGFMATIESLSYDARRPLGMTMTQFALFPVTAILLFAGFVTAALLLRRRADLHKRFMVLAMIAVLGPPAARLIRWAGLVENFLVIQVAVTAAFVALALISDWMRQRVLHPVYLIGGGLLVLSWPARVWLATTPAWEAVGSWMQSLAT